MKNKYSDVLIVDDRAENLLVLEGLLEDLPCNIVKASSGNEALGLMLYYEFALVLLDVQMPEMDGFEVASLMRSSEKTRNIPIVFVTAIYKEQNYIFKGYEIGAVDYLFKPIEPVILRSKVNVFLELDLQRKQLKEQAENINLKLQQLLLLQESNEKLKTLSSIDGLTGIPNRRSFDEYMLIHWKDSYRRQAPISLIMADIDFFKAYNDNYGHLQGDDCLIKVAQALYGSVKRSKDFVARYGGEEFALILPDTDQEEAILFAKELLNKIRELSLIHNYSKIGPNVTISIGVHSLVPTDLNTLTSFICGADSALYQAKQTGRNKACIY
jgi:diguanylate cyclase (GGDEF)-like protein